MIAVDTNIIIRLLTKDDIKQYKKAYAVFNTQEVYIPDTVILETDWVLRCAYQIPVEDICDALSKLFGLANVHLSNPVGTCQAIEWHRQGVDFSDALHLSQCQQYDKLFTFDKRFSSRARGLSKCSVESP